MGRYYHGDIEGKFWFAVQPSDDPAFFGMQESDAYIQYYIDDSDIDEVKEGIRTCKMKLKGNLRKINKFFKDNNGYNDTMLKEANINPKLIVWYARLGLGKKILECVEDTGSCWLEAET